MLKYLLIALGGALGSLMRYAIQGGIQRLLFGAVYRTACAGTPGNAFPIGTLAVNVSGCLLMGFLGGVFAGTQFLREEYRLGLTVGILGGFTTFSTFGFESFQLMNAGQHWLALLNVALSCILGIVAVGVGHRVAVGLFAV